MSAAQVCCKLYNDEFTVNLNKRALQKCVKDQQVDNKALRSWIPPLGGLDNDTFQVDLC